jgi:hypothetical protein
MKPMENKEQTAIDWFFDKIKSHFEHDGDLYESLVITYSIAKIKERNHIIDAYDNGANERDNDPVNGYEYYKETYNK